VREETRKHRVLPTFQNGKSAGWRALRQTLIADAAGRITVPARTGMLRLFVVHDAREH
jgi:hypothetical protein